MVKIKRPIFKCPNCGKHIHTLTSYYTDGIMYCFLNIGKNGEVFTTREESDVNAPCKYSCNDCGYHSTNMKDFITKESCDCEHEYRTTTFYDELEIDVCDRCGVAWIM